MSYTFEAVARVCRIPRKRLLAIVRWAEITDRPIFVYAPGNDPRLPMLPSGARWWTDYELRRRPAAYRRDRSEWTLEPLDADEEQGAHFLPIFNMAKIAGRLYYASFDPPGRSFTEEQYNDQISLPEPWDPAWSS